VIAGTDSAETLSGGGGSDGLYANGGDDVLDGGAANDLLEGGSGADTLTGGDGDDTVDGGPGDDLIVGGSGAGDDTYTGGDGVDEVTYESTTAGVTVDLAAGTATGSEIGTDTLSGIENASGGSGNDTLTGDAGDNTLEGFGGDDTLIGGLGDDTYVYASGDDNDLIIDTGGASDVLSLDSIATLVGGARDGDDAVLDMAGGGSVRIQDQFATAVSVVEAVFAPDSPGLRLSSAFAGPAGGDLLLGTDSNNFFGAGAGDDLVFANAGNDVMDAGPGDDTFFGGADNDTYQYTLGDGNDLLDDESGLDFLEIADIQTVADVHRTGDAIVLTFSDGGTVTGIDHFAGKLIDFAEDLDSGDIRNLVTGTTGPTGPDIVAGTAVGDVSDGGMGSDLVFGHTGNDTLSGGTDDDTVFGGAGNDTVSGEGGNDSLLGGSGAGNDVLDGGTGIDTVTYASATAPVGVDLSVNLANDGQGGFDTLFGIENIIGGSGGGALVGNDGANAITGGAGNDRLADRAGADTLDGGDGGDTLSGGAGNDTVLGGAGNDALYGFDESAVPRSLADTGVFPEVAKLVAIGDLPSPGDGALGIVADDTSLGGFDVIAKLTYVGGTAGYANTVGVYTVAADGTIGPVSVAFQDAQALSPGDMANVAVPGSGSDFGLFLIVHGARLNSGYQGLDFETGTLSFVHDLDGAGERAAKITDSGTDLSLVFDDGETQTVLQGPVVHSTERGGATVLNADNTVHVAAGRLSAGNETTLRVGFEDLPGGGDSDFNDVIVDVEILPDMAPATDTLGGGAGNDTLTGGLGGDVFVFGAGGGTDRITDFEVGSDVFDLQDGVTIATIATVDADSDGFTDDTLVTLSDGAVELIGVTGITEADLLGA